MNATLDNCTRICALVADYAFGLDMAPQGLTPSELARAWRARHGGALPNWPYRRLYLAGVIVRGPRRPCTVVGTFERPFLPKLGRR